MQSDPIERLSEQWHAELPDLDTNAMASIARLNRARALTLKQVTTALDAAGSSLADFDVLSALRRQGPPYRMKPSSIARLVMLSASGMTSRIDHLVDVGLVARVDDPTNRRTAPVELTSAGVAEAERLVLLLVETEEAMMASLTSTERSTLDHLLTKLTAGLTED